MLKINGVYGARLVACSYSQISEFDFSENDFPVEHNITYCILMSLMLILQHKNDGHEDNFSCGDLEEQIYMECLPGLKPNEDDTLILNKCIYGLVQSAHKYYKKAVRILEMLGCTGSLCP